jgi:hypothetical protein
MYLKLWRRLRAMLSQPARRWQTKAKLSRDKQSMSEENRCPMGNHPWLATFLALAFILLFLSKKLGLL